ncbi:uncharacterized protein LOC110870461 [Helianthus annuus]|uniref:uncharacterized protein LOC110870461 n=1 Tax=Helianthus annuus TaxID=4232 RepID=UPI000B8FC611|nr:uncharacterized protein LOC110870461 [Helianthus annuus]
MSHQEITRLTEAEWLAHASRVRARHEVLRYQHGEGASGRELPNGCTYQFFLECNPPNFGGTGGAIAFVKWAENVDAVVRMSGCMPEQQVPYISGLLQDGALLWWDRKVRELDEAVAYALSWSELKEIMRKEYCSQKDIQGLELEFRELQKEGPDVVKHVKRLYDLSRVIPYLVEPELKRMEQSIWELTPQALSLMMASTPPSPMIAHVTGLELTKEAFRLVKLSIPDEKKETTMETSGKNKRKLGKSQGGDQAKERRRAKKGKMYLGNLPKCEVCQRHHKGKCNNRKCDHCGNRGHDRETCWQEAKRGKEGCNCGGMGHLGKDCPRETNQDHEETSNTGASKACQDPDMVTGTFFVNPKSCIHII